MTSTFLLQVYICAKSYGKFMISPLEQGLLPLMFFQQKIWFGRYTTKDHILSIPVQ